MRKRLFVYGSLVFLVLLSLAAYLVQQGVLQDESARVGMPIARASGDVQPLLEVVAEDLGLIWGLEFVPGTSALLATAKSGSMFLIDTETLAVTEIGGGPAVDARGQGGLLDVAISPEFDQDGFVYLTYSAANEAGETTTFLARAVLDLEEYRFNDLQELFFAEPFQRSTAHYGSRVVVQGDYLYMTIGDRGDKNFDNHVSQDTTNVLGTTVRLRRDGTVPEDNPFVDDPQVHDAIYTYGHRNAQGMTIHPDTGEIWQSEHGERDGDEINVIYGGNNYGWPIATHGCAYGTSRPVGVHPEERDDTISPVHYWECGSGGFPPAGMTFYDADGFADWRGDLFVGGLAGRYLAHFRVIEDGLEELAPLLAEEGWRVRDVTVGRHDGAIYAAVEGRTVSIVRIVPQPVD